jgi:hypothetical protein
VGVQAFGYISYQTVENGRRGKHFGKFAEVIIYLFFHLFHSSLVCGPIILCNFTIMASTFIIDLRLFEHFRWGARYREVNRLLTIRKHDVTG